MSETRTIPEGSVIISPADVYSEVKMLTESVRTLIAKDANDPLPAVVAELRTETAKLNDRVRWLEQKVWMASGMAAALGGSVGALIAQRFGG